MDLQSTSFQHGLVGRANPVQNNVTNAVNVGATTGSLSLSSAATVISFDAIIAGAASDLVIDISDLDSTGTTAWTAGTAQVETATVVGTITTAGNAEVVVTSAIVTGSPITLSVAVALSDTASDVATKIRTALSADSAITTYFSIGGTGADVVLTHKGSKQYTINGTSVPVYPANDATLNVSIDNDTCAGLTTAATSTDTTAGVASAGVYVQNLDGNDFEGEATGGATAIYGIYIANKSTSSDSVLVTQGTAVVDYAVPASGYFQAADPAGGLEATDITIEPGTAGPCLVTVTLATD